MESGKILKNSQIIILGVCIAAATVISSVIISQGALKLMKFSREVITVTGSAQKEIKSDLIVWKVVVTRRENELKSAYKGLKTDLEKTRKFLIEKGAKEKDMTVAQVSTETIYRKNEKGLDTNDIQGYRLFQTIEVKSRDVEPVTEISRQVTDLIDQGIQLESQMPEYFYMKLDELKVMMLAEATENAKQRAANMASATGNKIGFMRSARMGVFQITPVNSTEISDWGVNDTSSLEKKVTAVVTVSFAIE